MSNEWHPTAFEAYEPSLKRAVAAASAFVAAARAGLPGRWLTLSGVPGCGKTELASQTYLEARKSNPADRQGAWVAGVGTYNERMRRPGCRFLGATEFADICRRDFDFPETLGIDYLVAIDDVGAARDHTAFVAEALYRLANARVGKYTILTTNLSLPEFAAKIDERLASRTIRDSGSVFVRIAAGDYGMRRNAKNA